MEKLAWKGWKQASLQRKWMNMGNSKIKNWLINRVFRGWNRQRADLYFPDKSFNQRWVEKHKS
jgi:L-lactate dehydrogenase complex protein LldF